MDDVVGRIGAVTREVRDVERDGKPALMVVATRTYETTIEDLWDAITSPERIPRWFLPISGDLKPGGRYQLEGNAGGTINVCEPPHSLEVTWEFGGGTSWVNVYLSEEGGGTRLELQHIAHRDPHWDEFGPGAVGVGWDLGLMGLAQHIADPARLRPPEGDPSWLASDEAMQFMSLSSGAWVQAAIAHGDDRAHALEAGERTRSFYCGG